MILSKITDDVIKFEGESNVYFIKSLSTIIDCGNKVDKEELKKLVSTIVDPSKIEKVLFTHLHYDHVDNVDLFPNAKFYASQDMIDFFNKNHDNCTLDPDASKLLETITLLPFENIPEIEIIETPGHTVGSVCFLYKDVLFSGDTLFGSSLGHATGRTDFPSGSYKLLKSSLDKIKKIKYEHLCPGHL